MQQFEKLAKLPGFSGTLLPGNPLDDTLLRPNFEAVDPPEQGPERVQPADITDDGTIEPDDDDNGSETDGDDVELGADEMQALCDI